MKKTSIIAALILMSLFFTAYLMAVLLQPDNWADILSPINAFLAGTVLFIAFYRSNHKVKISYGLLFFSLACFCWALADTLWAINTLALAVDPSEIVLVTFFYVLTNIFLGAGVLLYAIDQFKRWNIAKLHLDIVVFSFVAILLIWILFFNRSNEIFAIFTVEGTFSVICIVTDILIYIGMVIWYLSIRGGRIPPVVRFVSSGIFLFVLTDLYYYYIAYNNIYVVNSLIDAVYLFSLLIVAGGGLVNLSFDYPQIHLSPDLSSNTGKRSKEFFILLCPLLVILVRGFVLAEFLVFISLTVVYMAWNSYLQNSIKNEELVKKNDALSYLSNMDTLTNLYNRRYFLNYLDDSIAKLNDHQTLTLFYMDLDRFKLINDTYGHHMGDRVLLEISRRLEQSADGNATIARMGGDEFVLAATSFADNAAAIEMAKTIILNCSQELFINGYVFYPALCIGISIYPHDAEDAEALIKNADIALYHAKSLGINKFAGYDSLIHDKNQKRNEIELFLRHADFFKDLRLYYQPQFSIPDRKLAGVEALIRWVSADNEIMTPQEFINIAEETDHINEIGLWVLKEAVTQIVDWNTRFQQSLRMGINISPKQFNSTNLLTELNLLAQNQAFNPQWLDIELTENIVMDGEYRMSQIFKLFKSIGLSVSIDDFGTGYSSISYLKHFTIDRIKIAKPLIDSIVTSTKDKQIVQAIVLLAKTIGIQTIAEGVETSEQLDTLAEIGCEQIQGFYLGKPVPPDQFENLFLKDGLN